MADQGITWDIVPQSSTPSADSTPPAQSDGITWHDTPIALGQPTSPDTNGAPFGSFASGANKGIAAGFGAPVDLMTGALNLVPRGINAATGSQIPLIEHPIGGSESISDLITSLVGDTKPKRDIDKALYATGAGVGATASTMLGGGALKAGGLLPKFLESLFPDASIAGKGKSVEEALADVGRANSGEAIAPQAATIPQRLGNAATIAKPFAYGGAGGLGGYLGQNAAAQISNNPLVQLGGNLVGNLGLGGGAALLGEGGPAAWNTLRAPFTREGQQATVGKILNESATNSPRVIEGTDITIPSSIPYDPLSPTPFGIRPTFGQATNDPGILALERSVEQRTPSIQGDFNAQKAANNDLVGRQVGQIGTVGNPGEISQALAARLDAQRQTAKAGVDQAYGQIPEVSVPTQPLKDAFNGYVNSLTQVRRQFVPKNYQDLLTGYPDQVPMRELMDLRSSILSDQRGAQNAGDFNRANVLGNIEQALFKGLPEGGAPLPATADQAATMAYQRASKQAAEYHQTFNTDQPIASVFQRNSTGGEKILDSAVAEKLLGSGAGQADRVNQFLRASKMDPDATQAARDWFATKLQQATQGAPQAGSEQPVLNASSLRKFVQNNQDLINSRIFNDQQRTTIENIVKAREILERTANGGIRGGSDTAAKLLGNNYLSALLGKWGTAVKAAPLAGAGAGAHVGDVLGGPGLAFVMGSMGKAAGEALPSAYEGVGQKITSLLAQTMRDPVLAQELMRRATPKGDFVTSPYLRSLLGLPGTVKATR